MSYHVGEVRVRSDSCGPEQRAIYEEAFAVFDRDGDGTISSSELGDVMRSLGLDPSEEEVSDILVRFDADGNGEIDKDEFVTMMNAILNCSADDDQEIVEAFKVFDIDGDGYITAHELFERLKNLGEDLTEEDVELMLFHADIDRDGVVSQSDFANMIKEYEYIKT